MEFIEFNQIENPGRRTPGDPPGDPRGEIGRLVGGDPAGVVFTSSGAEALNLAVKGVAWGARRATRIVRSALEDAPVRDACRFLAGQGYPGTVVGIDGSGLLDPEAVAAELAPDTALLVVTAASAEIGTLPPLATLGRLATERGVPFVVDATAAAGRLALDAERWNATAVAVSGRRLGGPAGTGALWVRPGTRLVPLIHGGLEENGLRAGALDPGARAAFAAASRDADEERPALVERLAPLTDRLRTALLALDGVEGTGPTAPRLPGHVSVLVDGVDGEALVVDLARRRIRLGTGSACSRTGRLSPVLAALGHPPRSARGSLVATLPGDADAETVDRVVAAVADTVRRLRALAPREPA